MRTALNFGLLFTALIANIFAQATGSATNNPASPQPILVTGTSLVIVPTLVETQGKELVFSLNARDFTLTDNGVPQKVILDEDAARPLSLVVLMQTGGAARSQFKSYLNLETMLSTILGGKPNTISIVNFDSRVESASPFTSDIAQWSEAINHPDPGDSGAAIYDGLAYSLDLLKQQPSQDRRAILLISQQRDEGSQAQLKDIIRTLGETDTTVYSLTFSAEKANIRQAFKDPAHLNKPITIGGPPPTAVGAGTFTTQGPEQYQAYFDLSAPLNLAVEAMRKDMSAEVANLSGGEASTFDNRNELDQSLGVLVNHIRNSYILSFSPTSRQPGLHTIKVNLTHHPELLVTARTNYWSSKSTVDRRSER